MHAAADYAVAPGAARYAALDDGENYASLFHAAGEIDPAAQARAPRSPYEHDSRHYDAGPLPEIAEVVSLVVPTLVGVALDRLVDVVAGWLRRRRPAIPGTGQIARIYGPNGELLKEVEVTESTASRGR